MKDHMCYGTTTVGEKGQVVIPAEARQALGLKKGEKLLVFGIGSGVLTFTKVDQLEKIATHLSKKLQSIRGFLDNSK